MPRSRGPTLCAEAPSSLGSLAWVLRFHWEKGRQFNYLALYSS